MSSKKAFFQLLSVILERKSQSKLMNHGRHVEKKNWKWRNILNNFLSFLCHLNFWSWSHFFTSGSFFSDFLIWWMLYVVFFLFFFLLLSTRVCNVAAEKVYRLLSANFLIYVFEKDIFLIRLRGHRLIFSDNRSLFQDPDGPLLSEAIHPGRQENRLIKPHINFTISPFCRICKDHEPGWKQKIQTNDFNQRPRRAVLSQATTHMSLVIYPPWQ